MSKTILVLTGSARVGGNSDQLADAFVRGVLASGKSVLRFDAGRKNIGPCMGCESCFSTGRPCCGSDDFDEFAQYLQQADAIAIFTPIYWFNYPARIKAAIDRMYCFYAGQQPTKVKESIMVVCGGDTNMEIYQSMIGTYEHICDAIGWENKGHIIVPGVHEAGAGQKTPAIAGMEKIGTYY